MGRKRRFAKSIMPTLLLVFVMSGCFLIGALRVNRIAMENCLNTLDDATSQFVSEIKRNMSIRRQQLEVIAEILAEYDDIASAEARIHMSSIQQRGVLSSLTVLLPDNQVIFFKDGKYQKQESMLDYEEEVLKGAYVSGVIPSDLNEKEKFIYQAVPIEKDGNIKGIIYELINLNTFPEIYTSAAFGWNAQLYILDGETGDFLLDTWHDELGNFYDDAMGMRKTRQGYDFEQWIQDLKDGKEGYLVFEPKDAGEDFYAYAQPVGINRWMAQLTAPESVVFEGAIRIRRVLYILAVMNMVLLLSYFRWNVFRIRKRAALREMQLQQTTYMYDVQKCLFDAHKYPERMEEALHKAGRILDASVTFLCSLDKLQIRKIYRWADEKLDRKELAQEEKVQQVFDLVREKIVRNESVLLDSRDKEYEIGMWDRTAMEKLHISSLMMVPIQDSEGDLIGALGAVNMKQHWKEASPLECVAWNFMMALNNMQSYEIIQKMGTIDETTLLKNRNSYEKELRECRKGEKDRFCCIYIDADGLHELNNILGHAAGDSMLSYIGEVIRGRFGSENAYRIGGDEFVIFCRNIPKEEVREKICQMEELLRQRDYHVSVGTAWCDGVMHLNQLILTAEQKMYEAKHSYYEEKGAANKTRKMNTKLEKILLEKKDADMFLSIIAAYFKGVYVVDLDTGDARIIYQSPYFTEALEKPDNRFQEVLELYADSYVHEEDKEKFCQFIRFDRMKKELQDGGIPVLIYRRQDGKQLVLHIYRDADYSGKKRETFWLFEECK